MKIPLSEKRFFWPAVIAFVAFALLLGLYPLHKRRVHDADLKTPFNQTGGVANYLSLSIAFEPTSQFFHIHLKNNRPEDLQLCVEPKKFFGKLILGREGREPASYYQKDMMERLSSGRWVDPVVGLKKGGEIVWDVPFTDLRDADDHPVTLKDLIGSVVIAELDRVAVVPPTSLLPPRGHIFQTSNALQRSPALRIERRAR